MAIDLSGAQLHCLALRVAAYRGLSIRSCSSSSGRGRALAGARCSSAAGPSSTPATVAFWERRWTEAERWGIGGVGRLESYFRLFRRWVLPWVHRTGTVDELLRAKPLEARTRFYARSWNTLAWRTLLNGFFGRFVMARLGRDPAFFRYVDGSVAAHVENTGRARADRSSIRPTTRTCTGS